MGAMTAKPLRSYSKVWTYLLQEMTPTIPTKIPTTPPAGTVLVPRGVWQYVTRGVMIEGDDGHGVDTVSVPIRWSC
jgi:hypothetical protein